MLFHTKKGVTVFIEADSGKKSVWVTKMDNILLTPDEAREIASLLTETANKIKPQEPPFYCPRCGPLWSKDTDGDSCCICHSPVQSQQEIADALQRANSNAEARSIAKSIEINGK